MGLYAKILGEVDSSIASESNNVGVSKSPICKNNASNRQHAYYQN